MEAAVQLGIAVPPLPSLRPGSSGVRAIRSQVPPGGQESPKYSLGTTLSLATIAHIIKKDRDFDFFPTYFIRVESAVQLGISVPPLPTYGWPDQMIDRSTIDVLSPRLPIQM